MGPHGATGGYLLGERALPVSRRCQVGAGSENAVRRVLRELAGERGTFASAPRRLGGPGGDIDHFVQARSGVGYVIEAETRRPGDRRVVRAGRYGLCPS